MATAKSPYFDLLLGTIEAFNRCESGAAVSQSLIDLTSRLGYEFAAYIASPSKESTFKARMILGNWPKGWIDQYAQPGWNKCDRVAQALHVNKRAFTWSSVEISPEDKPARRVMETAARDFGMRSGICVPIHDRGGYRSGFSFSGTEADQSEDAIGVLQLLSFYAESRLQCVQTSPESSKRLTPREREILIWGAAGKSDWDIGQILNIAEGTVKRTAANAMVKLGTYNRTQAVAEAIRSGEIKI